MCEKKINVPALFGEMVFGEQQMQQRLPADVYRAWQQSLAQGTALDRSVAGEIAGAMKDWAIEKGATHYTHWFQPMTGFTAGGLRATFEAEATRPGTPPPTPS